MSIARSLTPWSVAFAALLSASSAFAGDPLPSWNDAPAKRSIVSFVERVVKEGRPDFVPVADRVAAFDNDGTLWSEQPCYVQAAFAVDRLKVLAAEHPEWKEKPPFKAVLEKGLEGIAHAPFAHHRERAETRAVIAALAIDDSGATRRRARDFQRRFDRLGPTVGEKTNTQRFGHTREQRLRQIRGIRRRPGVIQIRRLVGEKRLQALRQPRMIVPEIQRAETGEKIQILPAPSEKLPPVALPPGLLAAPATPCVP